MSIWASMKGQGALGQAGGAREDRATEDWATEDRADGQGGDLVGVAVQEQGVDALGFGEGAAFLGAHHHEGSGHRVGPHAIAADDCDGSGGVCQRRAGFGVYGMGQQTVTDLDPMAIVA